MALLRYGSKGEQVKRLQRLLNRGRFHKFAKPLVVDGELGPKTASRIHNTKYWAGYDRGHLEPDIEDQIAGKFFFGLLDRSTPLPDDYRARRKKRLAKAAAAAAKKPLREKTLAAAVKDDGLLEGPNNAIKYNDWWCAPRPNDGGAYCVRAGSYWAAEAGCPHVKRGWKWQNTDDLLADAKAGRNGVHLTSDPEPGNGFVIDWSGHSDPDHFGLYVSDIPGGLFRSFEANATLANGRQGVGYHQRAEWQCWFIVFED